MGSLLGTRQDKLFIVDAVAKDVIETEPFCN